MKTLGFLLSSVFISCYCTVFIEVEQFPKGTTNTSEMVFIRNKHGKKVVCYGFHDFRCNFYNSERSYAVSKYGDLLEEYNLDGQLNIHKSRFCEFSSFVTIDYEIENIEINQRYIDNEQLIIFSINKNQSISHCKIDVENLKIVCRVFTPFKKYERYEILSIYVDKYLYLLGSPHKRNPALFKCDYNLSAIGTCSKIAKLHTGNVGMRNIIVVDNEVNHVYFYKEFINSNKLEYGTIDQFEIGSISTLDIRTIEIFIPPSIECKKKEEEEEVENAMRILMNFVMIPLIILLAVLVTILLCHIYRCNERIKINNRDITVKV